ncbi:MAG: MBL fold metallo-hydrolase [Chitinophagaceae bacterium]
MTLQICALNSGSNGNCYYIGNSQNAVLVDAGLSCRETEIRMKQVGLSMKLVKGIFVSHEHTDHIKGVSTIANKYNIPVFISEETAKQGPRLIRPISTSIYDTEIITIGNLSITPFRKYHDAVDPFSFIVSYNDITVGVFTDIGKVCDKLKHYFSLCHAVFLESNYDEKMLAEGGYPEYLKNRIRGGDGHLSNTEAVNLFEKHRSPQLTHCILAHLSKENNHPAIVESLFQAKANNIFIKAASRYEPSEIFTISNSMINKSSTNDAGVQQMKLF